MTAPLPDLVVSKLESLPARPGCYLFRDREGAVLYVGKAKSLRSRVRSYFQEGTGDTRHFIPVLRRVIGDLETVVVDSEKEAAILENSLIKEHKPRFNVKLRDDKEFLSLRLDATAAWPRLEVVRKPRTDGARYFGPYPSSSGARRTLHLVNKHFQLRTCTDTEFAARKRPCLQYQIKRCPGPCVYEVDRGHYEAQVRSVALFLDGRHDELSVELEARMREASRAMHFELAAVYRDQLRAIAAVREGQRLVGEKDVDQDVIGLFRQGDLAEIAFIYIRGGRVRDTSGFLLTGVEVDDDEVVAAVVRQFYGEGGPGAGSVPAEVLVPALPEGAEGVEEWLSDVRGKPVALTHPKRGKKAELLTLANDNAAHAFREKQRERDDVDRRLAEVQRRLRLPRPPRRIECVDISHMGGQDTVGAVVALRNGIPDKSHYRVFRVRGAAAGDDYGAMYEVLARRFRRGREAAMGSPLPTPVATPADRPLLVADSAGPVAAHAHGADSADAADESDSPETSAYDLTPLPPPVVVRERVAGGGDLADAGDDADAEGEPELEHEAAPGDTEGVQGDSERADGADGDAEGARDDDPQPLPGLLTPSEQAENGWELPDLLVVDGGRGQLNVALTAARDLGLTGLPIVGLAKERQLRSGEELVDRVYLPGQKNGIALRPQSASLFFLARARDEAHRFSNFARERLAKSRTFRSALDDIPGIGKRTRIALLTAFGSVAAVKRASDRDLLAVPGVGAKAVASLRAHFGPPAPPVEEVAVGQGGGEQGGG